MSHACVAERKRLAEMTVACTGASRAAMCVPSWPVKPIGFSPGSSCTLREPLGRGRMSVSTHFSGGVPGATRMKSGSRWVSVTFTVLSSEFVEKWDRHAPSCC
ncbi:MAG: hypothetical protein IIB88_03730, partial [Chloroflexi bacterium]|nr:hypothetical protein [Chloroflexota bacterium]